MAASTNIMNSSDVVIRIGTDGSTFTTIGKMTSASLSVSVETRDTTNKDSGAWNESLVGMKSWTLSGEGLVVYSNTGKATPDDVYTYLNDRTEIYIEFGSETADEIYYSGQGFITEFTNDSGFEDNATFSFSVQGNGALTQATRA